MKNWRGSVLKKCKVNIMNDEPFHDIVIIWLLRRLDLGEAKREVWQEYQDLCENDELYELSRDELIVHMLDILDTK
jgi:hypothetical protein